MSDLLLQYPYSALAAGILDTDQFISELSIVLESQPDQGQSAWVQITQLHQQSLLNTAQVDKISTLITALTGYSDSIPVLSDQGAQPQTLPPQASGTSPLKITPKEVISVETGATANQPKLKQTSTPSPTKKVPNSTTQSKQHAKNRKTDRQAARLHLEADSDSKTDTDTSIKLPKVELGSPVDEATQLYNSNHQNRAHSSPPLNTHSFDEATELYVGAEPASQTTAGSLPDQQQATAINMAHQFRAPQDPIDAAISNDAFSAPSNAHHALQETLLRHDDPMMAAAAYEHPINSQHKAEEDLFETPPLEDTGASFSAAHANRKNSSPFTSATDADKNKVWHAMTAFPWHVALPMVLLFALATIAVVQVAVHSERLSVEEIKARSSALINESLNSDASSSSPDTSPNLFLENSDELNPSTPESTVSNSTIHTSAVNKSATSNLSDNDRSAEPETSIIKPLITVDSIYQKASHAALLKSIEPLSAEGSALAGLDKMIKLDPFDPLTRQLRVEIAQAYLAMAKESRQNNRWKEAEGYVNKAIFIRNEKAMPINMPE